jgi:hypothetical protein
LLAGPSDDVDLLGGASLAANQYWQARGLATPLDARRADRSPKRCCTPAFVNRRESQLDPETLVRFHSPWPKNIDELFVLIGMTRASRKHQLETRQLPTGAGIGS